MCGFCRITDLGILLSNFSNKNYSSKVYTYLKKVVVLVTQKTTKLSLPFFDFSTILYRFYKFQPTHKEGVESLCTQAPGTFKSSQLYPSLLRPDPRVPKSPTSRTSTAEGRPPPAMWVRRRQTNGAGLRLALPSIDWWWRFSRGGHRRAAAAEQRRRGRGGSDGGEDRDGARQCVALVAPRCPREGARWVAGLGEPAERRARRWSPGDDRDNSDSGQCRWG
jgi:hypothetical protein